jgi:hypothetical protein
MTITLFSIQEAHMLKLVLSFFLLTSFNSYAQQISDTGFKPKNKTMTFSDSTAPIVLLDEAHHNFHTMDGRYQPFVKILRSDGYIVKKNKSSFSNKSLSDTDILIISNALNKRNIRNWNLPNHSAFSRKEVEAVHQWVKNGGRLFLIADHMPFPKAAEEMAAIFGFQFNNGYAREPNNNEQLFQKSKGTLAPHPILKGLDNTHTIDVVRSFTGQAFLSPPNAKPLLIFNDSAISLMPSESWKFTSNTPQIPVKGWNQGASLEFHKGRVIVFGEAAMFTAQVSGNAKTKMGVIANGAEQNERFLLNIMLWLSGKI